LLSPWRSANGAEYEGQDMSESTSVLGQMGYPMMFALLAVVLVASGLFYSASKKFVRYFKRRQEQDDAENSDG
jgi:hypothetical protein